MRNTRALSIALVLSLAGNAAVVAFLLTRPAGERATSLPGQTARAVAHRDGGAMVPAAGKAGSLPIEGTATTWAALQNDDLPAMIERLRAAGFPSSSIRALVTARLADQFADKRLALLQEQETRPFWKGGFPSDPKVAADLRQLARDQGKLLRQLLPPETSADNPELAQAFMRYRYGNIDDAKLAQFKSILSDYGELRAQVAAGTNGTLLPEDREKLTLLSKEQRADLEKLLSPDELADYDLHTSSTANALRNQLSFFNPSEEEFRALFKLKQSYDQQLVGRALTADQLRGAQQQYQAQLKSTLGDARYAEYQQVADPSYISVARLVQRLDLPPATSSQVVAIQRDIQQRAAVLNAPGPLAPDQRTARLAALASEATTKLTSALGRTGYQDYRQTAGQWLQTLQSRPAPVMRSPPPPPPRG